MPDPKGRADCGFRNQLTKAYTSSGSHPFTSVTPSPSQIQRVIEGGGVASVPSSGDIYLLLKKLVSRLS